MTTNAHALRFRRSHEAIQRAMTELVMESNPDKITVKQIADRAQINRKTFYLHYDSIEALFDEHLDAVMNRFFDAAEQTPETPEDIEGHAVRFFLFLAQQDEPTTRLICTRGRYDYGGKLYRMQMERYAKAGNPFPTLNEAEFDLVAHFIRSTALQFFRRWVRNGRTVESQRAAELLGQLTTFGVRPLLHAVSQEAGTRQASNRS